MSQMREIKKELRKFMKSYLEKMSRDETTRQSDAVCERIFDSKWFQDAQKVSIYVSTVGEIQTDRIIRKALETGKEVFIPQFEKGRSEMIMERILDEETFEKLDAGLWGIRQSDGSQGWPRYQEAGPLDVILTPGVAFTPSGLRCGHGMGYYDRFFADHTARFPESSPLKVGLALRETIVRSLPMSETDVKMDVVLYEGEPIVSDQNGPLELK